MRLVVAVLSALVLSCCGSDPATPGREPGALTAPGAIRVTVEGHGAGFTLTWPHPEILGSSYSAAVVPVGYTGSPPPDAFVTFLVTRDAGKLEVAFLAYPGDGASITFDVVLVPAGAVVR